MNQTIIERSDHKLNEDEFDLREVFNTFLHYKWSILLITFLTVLMAAYSLYFKPDIYSSSAVIEVKSSAGGTTGSMSGGDFLGGALSGFGSSNVNKDIEILKTFHVNNIVLNKVNFQTQYFVDEGFKKVSMFFKKIGGEIVRVSNPRTAEFIKLIDNSWRNTRFAFANELAFLADMNNIDIMEAIKSANEGYERNKIPQPGPVSGYCLGKDPYLLEIAFTEIVKQRGFNSVWCIGRRANDWLNEKILENVSGKKVLVAGLTFKENIDDFRYSHSIDIIKKLIKKGFTVHVTDPYLDKNYYTRLKPDLEKKIKKYKSIEKAIPVADTVIFAVRHDDFKKIKWDEILKNRKKPLKIVDLWNIFPELRDKKNINYKCFGRN